MRLCVIAHHRIPLPNKLMMSLLGEGVPLVAPVAVLPLVLAAPLPVVPVDLPVDLLVDLPVVLAVVPLWAALLPVVPLPVVPQ